MVNGSTSHARSLSGHKLLTYIDRDMECDHASQVSEYTAGGIRTGETPLLKEIAHIRFFKHCQ